MLERATEEEERESMDRTNQLNHVSLHFHCTYLQISFNWNCLSRLLIRFKMIHQFKCKKRLYFRLTQSSERMRNFECNVSFEIMSALGSSRFPTISQPRNIKYNYFRNSFYQNLSCEESKLVQSNIPHHHLSFYWLDKWIG